MKKHDILYLGSSSRSRQQLLTESHIPFKLLKHHSDEQIPYDNDFNKLVLAIAQDKMNHVILPEHSAETGDYIFVLTSDSLVKTSLSNQIIGKPVDEEDAERILNVFLEETLEVATGCCLEKKVFQNGQWVSHYQHSWVTPATVEFWVAERWRKNYFKPGTYLLSAGAGELEGYGQNFFKSIKGSYTAARGLPIFELRQALMVAGFVFPEDV